MSKKGFWWASLDGCEPQVVEVIELTAGYEVAYVTGNDCEIDLDQVRLIERVAPAGPVTALPPASMTIEQMERDFAHHHRTELFASPADYWLWLQEQKRSAGETTA